LEECWIVGVRPRHYRTAWKLLREFLGLSANTETGKITFISPIPKLFNCIFSLLDKFFNLS
jgi:hypothetical protein